MAERIGFVLIFAEPETCPEVPYPAKREHVTEAEAARLEHHNEWTDRAAYEPSGWQGV